MKTVGEVLLAAAKEIEERGWCRNTVENSAGEVCALGALSLVLTGSAFGFPTAELYDPARIALLAQVGERGPAGVASYNNYHIKDKQDAIDWFLQAAANEGASV